MRCLQIGIGAIVPVALPVILEGKNFMRRLKPPPQFFDDDRIAITVYSVFINIVAKVHDHIDRRLGDIAISIEITLWIIRTRANTN